MAKKLKEVRPEDFNVQLLMAAAREGRLFIAEEYDETDKEQIISEVRAYVSRAKAFVTPQYQEIVDDIWEEIFATDDFAQMLMPGSKSRKCKSFDKYNVMRLIGVLREKGVYEQRSDRKFVSLLEQTDKDCSYRCYLGMGLERRSMLIRIRQIVDNFHF